MSITFTISNPSAAGSAQELNHTFTRGGTIGRNWECDWVLIDANRFISGKHALISYQNGAYQITDTSTNGVIMNDEKVPLGNGNSAMLTNGDVLKIGDYVIKVTINGVQAGATPSIPSDQSNIDKPYGEKVTSGAMEEEPADALDLFGKPPKAEPQNPIPQSLPDSEILPQSLKKHFKDSPNSKAPTDNKQFRSPNIIPDNWLDEENISKPPIAMPDDTMQFKAYYPKEIISNVWYTLLTYVYLKSAEDDVHVDSESRLDLSSGRNRQGYATSNTYIARGKKITVVPELPGCQFNPPSIGLLWLEDWHRLEFRMQFSEKYPGFNLNTASNGKISFYVGSILVAQINISIYVTDNLESYGSDKPVTTTSEVVDPFQAVFVSYSHRDGCIVERLEEAYIALGLTYLRDVHVLRSGEKWDDALLNKIQEADIFQLCWSNAAKQSINVEKEWRYALSLKRNSFLRPVYWEAPMPDPPEELSDLHFSFFPGT